MHTWFGKSLAFVVEQVLSLHQCLSFSIILQPHSVECLTPIC